MHWNTHDALAMIFSIVVKFLNKMLRLTTPNRLEPIYHIRGLYCICQYISFAVAKTVAAALVSSRLDYYNSLYQNVALNGNLETSTCAKLFGKGSYAVSSLTQYHFLNHCIGSLSNIALFLRSTVTYQTL